MKQIAQQSISNMAYAKWGVIQSFDAATWTAKVQLQPIDQDNPELSTTNSLPVLSPWVGNGWGLFAPPLIGSICLVNFIDTSWSVGVVVAFSFNQSNAPLSVPGGEFWLVHQAGSSIKMTNNGDIEISSNQNVQVNAENVTIGKMSAGNLKALLNEVAQGVYNGHTHVDSMSGTTSAPTQQMDATSLTSHTKAN